MNFKKFLATFMTGVMTVMSIAQSTVMPVGIGEKMQQTAYAQGEVPEDETTAANVTGGDQNGAGGLESEIVTSAANNAVKYPTTTCAAKEADGVTTTTTEYYVNLHRPPYTYYDSNTTFLLDYEWSGDSICFESNSSYVLVNSLGYVCCDGFYGNKSKTIRITAYVKDSEGNVRAEDSITFGLMPIKTTTTTTTTEKEYYVKLYAPSQGYYQPNESFSLKYDWSGDSIRFESNKDFVSVYSSGNVYCTEYSGSIDNTDVTITAYVMDSEGNVRAEDSVCFKVAPTPTTRSTQMTTTAKTTTTTTQSYYVKLYAPSQSYYQPTESFSLKYDWSGDSISFESDQSYVRVDSSGNVYCGEYYGWGSAYTVTITAYVKDSDGKVRAKDSTTFNYRPWTTETIPEPTTTTTSKTTTTTVTKPGSVSKTTATTTKSYYVELYGPSQDYYNAGDSFYIYYDWSGDSISFESDNSYVRVDSGGYVYCERFYGYMSEEVTITAYVKDSDGNVRAEDSIWFELMPITTTPMPTTTTTTTTSKTTTKATTTTMQSYYVKLYDPPHSYYEPYMSFSLDYDWSGDSISFESDKSYVRVDSNGKVYCGINSEGYDVKVTITAYVLDIDGNIRAEDSISFNLYFVTTYTTTSATTTTTTTSKTTTRTTNTTTKALVSYTCFTSVSLTYDIYMNKNPNKTVYTAGDKFDFTGMKAEIYIRSTDLYRYFYSDGSIVNDERQNHDSVLVDITDADIFMIDGKLSSTASFSDLSPGEHVIRGSKQVVHPDNPLINGVVDFAFDVTLIMRYGDANGDNVVNISDAVLIMQAVVNKDKYGLGGTSKEAITQSGIERADCYQPGSGLTAMDALAIQRFLLGTGSLPLL